MEDRFLALRRAALLDEAAREAWNRMAWLAGQLLRAPIVVVVIIAEDGPVIVSAAGTGGSRIASADSWPAGASIDPLLTSRTPIVVEDVDRHRDSLQALAVRQLGGGACVSVPLRTAEGHLLGSLIVLDRRNRKWTVREAALLTQLGEHASTELGLRLRIMELERQIALPPRDALTPAPVATVEEPIVGHDELTGLPNRLLLFDRLRQVLALARRYAEVLAVLHLDIDDFKGINSRLGVQTGDLVLQQVAASLITGIRESDTVARLSGDDFMIVLPRVGSLDNAIVVARKILNSVERTVQLNGQPVTIKASVGLAIYPEDGHDAASLIHLAEVALDRANALGEKVFAFDHGDTTSALP